MKAQVRLAELLAALSLATDLGMGQPSGHAVQTCALSVRLAHDLHLPDQRVSEVFYVALLRYLGCTADATEVARLSGDEIGLAAAVGPYVMGDVADRILHTDVPDPEHSMATAMSIHCEAASMLGSRLGLRDQVTVALRHGFERWDGKGHPTGLAAEDIPLATRISVLARDVLLWRRLGGAAAARDIVVRRRGKAYDPLVVDAYLRSSEDVADVSWEDFLASEPSPHMVAADDLDRLLEVFADFADLKIPFALGHSRRVSALAAGAGQILGLDHDRTAALRRAGLLHDLGRTGVSSRIWEKPGPLSADDWERVRLHPYYTERILHRSTPLAGLAGMAGSHHERLNGSGYHRGLRAAGLNESARILAAADAYAALRESRPYRAARSSAETLWLLKQDVESGALDASAVSAVISAAEEERPPLVDWPRRLSDREVEVLRLAVRGLTIRQVGNRLGIAPKTVDRHLQNSYAKMGVSSRAGAALFALEHGLLE
jgi:HD-GYP domain-containing protein (c-di-GMP phosphodiesterase class II)